MKKILLGCLFIILNQDFLVAQWEPDQRLTFDDSSSVTSYSNARCIAASCDTLHIVWHDLRNGNSEIYYKRSIDRGTTWGIDTRLTNDNGKSYYPSIAVLGPNVHVVWMDERDANREIYYKRSTDGGDSWEGDVRLTNNFANSYFPSIAVSGSDVHVVWHDERDSITGELYYKHSTDNGVTWSSDLRLTSQPEYSGMASIAVLAQYLHIVWYDRRDNNYEIYYKRSTDNGASWEQDVRLTNNSFLQSHPSIVLSGSNVHVVWVDWREAGTFYPEIYYKRSTDGGITWGTDARLTNNPLDSDCPSVAASGSNIHVVWQDWRSLSDYEMYYKQSTDAGTTWSNDFRLTNNAADSRFASIAIADSSVHVIWSDVRNDNCEIYYKRNLRGNIGVEEKKALELSRRVITIVPSMFRDKIVFRFTESCHGPVAVTLYNINGARIFQQVHLVSANSLTLSNRLIRRLSAGVYFLAVSSDHRELAKVKLIKY